MKQHQALKLIPLLVALAGCVKPPAAFHTTAPPPMADTGTTAKSPAGALEHPQVIALEPVASTKRGGPLEDVKWICAVNPAPTHDMVVWIKLRTLDAAGNHTVKFLPAPAGKLRIEFYLPDYERALIEGSVVVEKEAK